VLKNINLIKVRHVVQIMQMKLMKKRIGLLIIMEIMITWSLISYCWLQLTAIRLIIIF